MNSINNPTIDYLITFHDLTNSRSYEHNLHGLTVFGVQRKYAPQRVNVMLGFLIENGYDGFSCGDYFSPEGTGFIEQYVLSYEDSAFNRNRLCQLDSILLTLFPLKFNASVQRMVVDDDVSIPSATLSE